MPKVKVVNSSKEVDLDRVVELSQGDLVVATLDGKEINYFMTVPSVAHPDVSVVPLSFVNLETGFVNVNQRVLNKDTVGNILAHLPFNVVHVGKLDIRVYSSTSYTIEMNLSMLGVK